MDSDGAWSRRGVLLGGASALSVPLLHAAGASAATPVPRVVYWGNRTRREVALTFDAAFDDGGMVPVLDTFAASGMTASFALTGQWVLRYPELTRRIHGDGHHLISHGMTHRSFTRGGTHGRPLSRRERWWELDHAEAAFNEVLGVGVKPWFRPPYLSTNWTVARDCALHGWDQIAMRSIDGLGWMRYPWRFVRDRCLHAARNGTIYLFHVGHRSTDPDALPSIIAGLSTKGYAMGSVPWVIRP